eukprot:1178562-Prorocentrum_minimum.AAC.2
MHNRACAQPLACALTGVSHGFPWCSCDCCSSWRLILSSGLNRELEFLTYCVGCCSMDLPQSSDALKWSSLEGGLSSVAEGELSFPPEGELSSASEGELSSAPPTLPAPSSSSLSDCARRLRCLPGGDESPAGPSGVKEVGARVCEALWMGLAPGFGCRRVRSPAGPSVVGAVGARVCSPAGPSGVKAVGAMECEALWVGLAPPRWFPPGCSFRVLKCSM